MSNFGAGFRKAREAAGLPLDKLAGDTRISTRFLLAIESEEFHLLPGGIFNRGFIRAYAERLGMDPVQAVADYDSLSSSAAQEPLEVLRNAERASTRKTERSFYPIAAAILVLLIGGYYVVNRRYATKPEVAPTQPVIAPTASARSPEASAPPEQALLPEPAATTAQAPTTLPAAAPATVPEATSEKTPVVAPTPPPPVPIPIQQANQPATPAIVATPAPATLVAPAPASLTAVPATSVLVLDVNIKDVTWIRIAADGAVVLADNLQPGATRRISAERSLEITIGNAAGVGLKINGRDLGELGTNGRVRQFRITPENAARIQG